MSGKGDDRRPLSVDESTFAANWERIFGEKIDAALADVTDGARLGANSDSKPANDSSILSAPAIYINADTGEQVTEDWWPGDPAELIPNR